MQYAVACLVYTFSNDSRVIIYIHYNIKALVAVIMDRHFKNVSLLHNIMEKQHKRHCCYPFYYIFNMYIIVWFL